MYHGKHHSGARPIIGKKPGILFISLVLLAAVVVGGTVALLIDSTDAVTNTFSPVDVKIEINENKTDTTKSKITITNVETDAAVPVYVRATLVIYWKDTINDVEQIIPMPAGADVTTPAARSGWFMVEDIYYYESPLDPGDTTNVMTDVITVTVPKGSTAKCFIDVRAEAIQAQPAAAVKDAWRDVYVDADGKLVAHN